MKIRAEIAFLAFLIVVSSFLRFYQLGYSHYYGDETKTLYLRKDTSAFNFFMNQRKGPIQFLVVWGMEKLSGGYKESLIRLPFAIAGTLLVLVFYYFVRLKFGVKTAIFSSLFFTLSGFNIAFSRTAQYQVFYMLFGLMTLMSIRKFNYIIPGVLFALALLSHYDALFFAIPLFLMVNKKRFIKIILVSLVLSGLFYLPNIYLGFFSTNTFGYIAKRLTGSNYLTNNSLYTMLVYNPMYVYLVFLVVSAVYGLYKLPQKDIKFLSLWFFMPFIVFQLIMLNPGTHIHNYLIPLYILGGYGVGAFVTEIKSATILTIFLITILFTIILATQLWVYVPRFNTGYPWKNTSFANFPVTRVSSNYHLYLYGFPYNRGWDKIGQYINSSSGARNFYTNDNQTVADYYISDVSYIAPGSNFWPQYYIEIENPQQLKEETQIPKDIYMQVITTGIDNAKIFKRLL